MAYQFLIEETDADGVRSVTLNRPDKYNSWHEEMRAEMRDAFARAAVDPVLRALIVTGAGGKSFSAGEDVGGMKDLTEIGTRGFRAIVRSFHDVFDTIESMEIPVIAAIEGVAAGGGFEMALSCDFRVLAENAMLVMPEAKVGLIPGSGGCSRLVRHLGLGRAKELVMLGGRMGAGEARELGLATRVVSPGKAMEGAREIARELSKFAPLAIGMAKLVLNSCTDVDQETGRRLERLGQSVLKMTEDHKEGPRAFLEKRPPQWKAR